MDINITSNLAEIKPFFYHMVEEQIPTIFVGAPGTGKSQTLKAWVGERDWNYLSFVPSFAKPSQIGGIQIPDVKNSSCEFLYIELMKKIFDATETTVVHVQDLLQAPDTIAKQIMSLIEFREVNGTPIPDCVSFVLDTNDPSHRAGAGTVLGTTNNRCSIIEWPVDVKGWLEWAVSSGRIAREVILFIHANPDFLCSKEVPRGFTPYNTPRSWEKLSKAVSGGFTSFPFVQSFVGNEAASRFCPFLESLKDYGNLIAKIKADPDSAPTFDGNEFDRILGSIFILSNHFEKANVDKFIRYINRYSNREYTALLFELGVQVHPDSKETKAYVDYITNK